VGTEISVGRAAGDGAAGDGAAGVAPAGLDDAAMAAVTSIGLGAFAVPGLVVGVPGILLVLAVLLQLVGGAAWLPLARRWLAGVGIDRRRSAHVVRDAEVRKPGS
jgi:hypothetical protein